MPKNVVGSIPEFTNEESHVPSDEIEKESSVASESDANEQNPQSPEEEVQQEKETPSEPPTEETPAEEQIDAPSANTADLQDQLRQELNALRDERRELIHEIKDLRGQRREAKQAEIDTVQTKIDTLEDVNQDDVNLIDRVIRAKGYTTREESQKMLYEDRKRDSINKFFTEFPEYSEENDPDRRKFGPLLRELREYYKEPEDPRKWYNVLRKVHSDLYGSKSSGDRNTTVQKRQIEIAGVGSSGAQRSSSVESFSPEKRVILQQGGWSDEEIKRMEERASKE